MSKSIKQVRVPVSPDYRTAPTSLVEYAIGVMIILAMGLAILITMNGEALFGTLMFFGAIVAYIAVTIARNAR